MTQQAMPGEKQSVRILRRQKDLTIGIVLK
jgi:hypothetical protein